MADLTIGEAHALCMRKGRHVCQQPSGRTCVERGCMNAAGTYWGPYWCPDHDKERLDGITSALEAISVALNNSPDSGREADRG